MKRVAEIGGLALGVITLLLAICGIVYSAGQNDQTRTDGAKRMDKFESRLDTQEQRTNDIKNDVSSIRTDVRWIKRALGGKTDPAD